MTKLISIAALAGLLTNHGEAKPGFRGMFPNYDIVRVNGELWFGLGHPTPNAQSALAPNITPYGKDVLALFDSGVPPRQIWQQVCNLDSDGDGVTNGVELCDPNCEFEPNAAASNSRIECPEDHPEPTHPGVKDIEGDVDPDVDFGGLAPALIIHITCMILSWAVLAPTGILIAVFFKTSGPPPTWFKIHKICMSSAATLTVTGFIAIAVQLGGLVLDDAHKLLGFFVVLLAIAQPISGVFRAHLPKPGEAKSQARKIWEIQHQWTGRGAVAFAVGALFTGMPKVFDNAKIGGIIIILMFLAGSVASFAQVMFLRKPPAQIEKKFSGKEVSAPSSGKLSSGNPSFGKKKGDVFEAELNTPEVIEAKPAMEAAPVSVKIDMPVEVETEVVEEKDSEEEEDEEEEVPDVESTPAPEPARESKKKDFNDFEV